MATHGRFKNPVEATLTGIKDLFRKQPLATRLRPEDRLDGKNCLITGANSGLGYAIAVDLARRGANVYMACRRQIPEAGEKVKKESGSDKVWMLKVELADVRSVEAFCQEAKRQQLVWDVVVLNAGVTPARSRLTPQGLDEMMMVNYLSNFIMLRRFLEEGQIPNTVFAPASLGRSTFIPRVLFISSDSHQGASAIDFDLLDTYTSYGVQKAIHNYSYFKLVLNTFAVELARRLQAAEGKPEVSVNVMCPGPVNTNIIRDAPWALRVLLRGIFTLFFNHPPKLPGP
ncbi:MAG: SDR family NAD(P)-dependent oxidoreductase [Microscillaceae bacterium]|nr:SDR family NAD(P)-dependent oxidoreductase [Microscillaceae bacterium]